MYKDVVTLFNRRRGTDSDSWYATILYGVNLNIDRSTIVKTYGEQAQDLCVLNVALDGDRIAGKRYLLPKEWQKDASPETAITFASGEDADFFWAGEWDGSSVIPDEGYGIIGFRDYMEKHFDNVFEVSSVSQFSVIPHLEVTGK